MKDSIPQFLQDKLQLKTTNTKILPDTIKSFMFEYAKFYNWNTHKLNEIFRMMKKGYTFIPKCGYDGCSNHSRVLKNTLKIDDGCSKVHATKNRSLLKYGVESANQVVSKKEKTILSVKEKYGVDNVFQLESIKEKSKKTNLIKYGVEHSMQSSTIKLEMQKKSIKKYGVDSVNKLDSKKQKTKEIMLMRYGVENPQQIKSVQDKTKTTCLRKYGVENPQQNPIIHAKNIKSNYNRKEYKWKTGEISLVQGYEPIVLKELETAGYKYDDILTSPKDMPKIMYQLNGKEHRYFPDMFIPKDNIIIEVKSNYTLKLHWDKNQAKFEATKSQGFDFRLEVR